MVLDRISLVGGGSAKERFEGEDQPVLLMVREERLFFSFSLIHGISARL